MGEGNLISRWREGYFILRQDSWASPSKGQTVGGSPTASYFLLLRQKKVTKEKATLPYRPSGSFGRAIKLGGCATRPSRPHTPCHAAELKQCSPSPQFDRPPSAIQKGCNVKISNSKPNPEAQCGRNAPALAVDHVLACATRTLPLT